MEVKINADESRIPEILEKELNALKNVKEIHEIKNNYKSLLIKIITGSLADTYNMKYYQKLLIEKLIK